MAVRCINHYVQLVQSRVEIKGYSIAYFDSIAVFQSYVLRRVQQYGSTEGSDVIEIYDGISTQDCQV